MTPLNNIPNRTASCLMLIASIRDASENLAFTKSVPEETNAALAFCEIAVSVPPQWFTHDERVMVANVIGFLYGDAIKFIVDLNAGHISFVNKCGNLCNDRPLESFVDVMLREHIKEFGSVV
jgi:hypothetical protein